MALDNPPCSPKAFASSSNQRGRKTKTSSDASQEAPERARKDTPKEANCISRAASLLCVFTSVVSQAFLRRIPCPQGCGYCSSPPCAGNLFYHCGTGIHPCPAMASYYTTNQVCDGKRRTYGFAAADLSGLSLPDAPCEHTDIRGKPKNLTRDFLPPIMDAVKSADRAYRDCPSRQEPPTSPCAVSQKGVCGSGTDCRGYGRGIYRRDHRYNRRGLHHRRGGSKRACGSRACG